MFDILSRFLPRFTSERINSFDLITALRQSGQRQSIKVRREPARTYRMGFNKLRLNLKATFPE